MSFLIKTKPPHVSKKQFTELIPLVKNLVVKIGAEQSAVKTQEQMIQRVHELIGHLTSKTSRRVMYRTLKAAATHKLLMINFELFLNFNYLNFRLTLLNID